MGRKKAVANAADAIQMITLDDVRTRELKYLQRIEALKHCMHYIEDLLVKLEALDEENRLLENWLAYLSCDGLPKPHIPPDIRLFFVKLRYFEAENIERNIDWILSIDDRSVLDQSIYRIDKTRETVKKNKQPNFGLEYDQYVNLALKVLKSIEYYLADANLYSKAKPRILADIKEQKSAVHREISGFLDRYTYRLLMSEAAYMEDVNSKNAEYFFVGTHFEKHVWTIKNVAMRYEFLDEPYMIANLHCLDIEVVIPFKVLQDNLTLRGIHFHFDNFSERAKSYDQEITIPVESLNAGITDLRDCLANEWKIQVAIQLETRNTMLQKRLEYEEIKKQIEEEEAKRSKNKNKDQEEKKPKEIKLPREPPIVQDNEVPDIWKEFLKEEQKEFEDFLNTIYHPTLLNLEPHELNLKKYLILGGVFQLDFVDKPRHFDFLSSEFNMTWHENDCKLVIRNDIKIDSEAPRPTISNKKDATISQNTSDWFIIKMKLPEYLCLWGEPQPCHFEADVIGCIEEPKVEEEVVVTHKHKRHTPVHGSNIALPTASNTHARNSAVPAVRSPAHATPERKASRSASTVATARSAVTDLTSAMEIDDFDLNFPLTKSEIRNLVRHCLPRILSSYKFPSEFNAEAKESSAKAKSAGGTLVRRHSTQTERFSQDNFEKSEITFSTSHQVNPERLYPVFPQAEELIIRKFNEGTSENEPKTFFDIVKRLDAIKRHYLGTSLRTTNLPFFKPNLKVLAKSKPTPAAKASITSRRSTRRPSMMSTVSGRESYRKTVDIKKSLKPLETPSTAAVQVAEERKPNEKRDDENPMEPLEQQEGNTQRLSLISPTECKRTFTFSRWTTRHIKRSEFDRINRTLTIWTDRLGVIGLAYKRYEQFPFRFWSLEPSEENPESEVVFTLETQYAKVVLFITGEGVRGYVTDLQKKFVRNRPMYLVINEPLKDFRELRKRFREKNLNIFTERDASFYIENGYFSQKHLATELHTYCCMCTYAQMMRFIYSEWNRLSNRRNLILRLVHHKESEDYMCTVRVQPEESTFVTIKELCSDDLDVFNLEYTLTWRNIDFYADLHHLITSMYPSAPEQRVKDPHLLYYLKAILWEIRPLSFS